jgi:hypothetical protein
LTLAVLCAGLVFSVSSSRLHSQESASAGSTAIQLPDAPHPQVDVAAADIPDQQSTAPAATGGTQESSSQTSAAPATADEKTKREQAEEQLKQQEKQRVFGVMATFNTTRNQDALPLSSSQKYRLFFKSATDPWAYSLAAVVAGIGQAKGDYPEWGQGVQGYAKKYGAAYSDYFIGNFFGNAVLPSLFHEDPRYFQKGKGSPMKRLLWAASSTVWCKRDNGTWGPNYANVMGNFIGTAIARVYYPASERTVGNTFEDGATVSAEGIIGAEVIEFWPDIVRHHEKKRAEKLAREAAKDAAGTNGK